MSKINDLRNDLLEKEREVYCLSSTNRRLERAVKLSRFSFSNLDENNITFYTGLSSKLFLWILNRFQNYVRPCLKKISFEDHLLIVLMKIRLGLLNTDLSFRFGISQTSISRILKHVIPKLSRCLKALLIWPTNDISYSNIPGSFKPEYKKVVSIIDCFEIFIERPHNLTARAQTWSNYKHHNTIKYLISITPSGAVNFISQPYMYNEQYIFLHSSLQLDKSCTCLSCWIV